MKQKPHWESVYAGKVQRHSVGTRRHPRRSLVFINRPALPKDARIIDVGGGDFSLVDNLLLDLSRAALNRARTRFGNVLADQVSWLEGDILELSLPSEAFDIRR